MKPWENPPRAYSFLIKLPAPPYRFPTEGKSALAHAMEICFNSTLEKKSWNDQGNT
jgi:hypothetical protein